MSQLKLRKIRQKRIRKKISGTATIPRLNVYKSLNAIYTQLIDDETGKVLASAHDLKTKGKDKKLDSAKKVGMELAKKAITAKISQCVFDRGGNIYHGRIKAVAEGAREGGLKF